MESKETYNSPIPLEENQQKGKSSLKDKDIQVIIGWILRGGVAVSMILVFIGGVFFVYRHGYSMPDYKTFKGIPFFVQNIGGILNGVIMLKGQAIIQLGIILLIATPVIRVAFSAVAFLMEKDYLYTVITLIVLLIIIASMISGNAG
ncbi:DUF1634 domain-containing protein [Mucilaginibacter sp. BT774]|uniref:DUF1634 domain-containing protein n=1 Tax=Mucilaginibacter sp. BT774 TaxID=3062276 RepID=UPI002675D80C|nr:DUF1634 domain-containing protein [Mucilaginibacter sp. BT774]MDO3624936.1 DUF1634 domain-containing protein [Mucilaginibacter sp. BT774]